MAAWSILAIIFIVNPLFANPVLIGGYDVQKIADSTRNELINSQLITSNFPSPLVGRLAPTLADTSALGALHSEGQRSPKVGEGQGEGIRSPLIAGTDIVNFYEKLGSELVTKKVISQEDISSITELASKSGGVKTGGVNPVVLAAGYLDLFVKKNVMTQATAQSILDSAKTRD